MEGRMLQRFLIGLALFLTLAVGSERSEASPSLCFELGHHPMSDWTTGGAFSPGVYQSSQHSDSLIHAVSDCCCACAAALAEELPHPGPAAVFRQIAPQICSEFSAVHPNRLERPPRLNLT
jgi:hypothetical protein